MLNVLIISDEARELYSIFKSAGFNYSREDPKKNDSSGKDSVNLKRYDIALLDLNTKGWQQRLLEIRQRMPVIAFAQPDVRMAVEAMKRGASDFLEKPLSSDVLREVISKYKKKSLSHKSGFEEILGTNKLMQEVFGLIKRAAVRDSNVLITGESGVGKEPCARTIHRQSPRNGKPFVTINCSAVPDTLLESELFGFEKGAFTGANYTNKDLRAACKKGMFREDLFYRLNVINIHIPSLRERMEDVPILAGHFIEKYASKRKDILVKGITDEALDILIKYTYPGNVRELENIIEHAISFTNTPKILPSDLPSYLLQSPSKRRLSTPRLREALASHERELIWTALQESRGNISKAAVSLGIHRQQLQRKIKALKIAT